MNPFIMIWGIPSTSMFSLKVTGGIPFEDKELSPKIGHTITQYSTYDYVLFSALDVDIYGSKDATGEKLRSTTIRMDTDGINRFI